MSEKAIIEDLSRLNVSSVLNILDEYDLMKHSSVFRENNINGYDFCLLTNDILKNDLGINSFHERSMIIKVRDKLLQEQLRINVGFEEKRIDIQLALDKQTKLIDLIPLVRSIYKINGSELIFCNQFDEILSYDVKIGELIIIDPTKYKHLKVKTEITKFSEKLPQDFPFLKSSLIESKIKDQHSLDIKDLTPSQKESRTSYTTKGPAFDKSIYDQKVPLHFKKDSRYEFQENEAENTNPEEVAFKIEKDVKVNHLIENLEKSNNTSRVNTKNDYSSNKRIMSSNRQSPERGGKLVDRIIEGYEKQKNTSEKDGFSEMKFEDFSKSTINQVNNKINQILKRNPSNDEKTFQVMGSTELKKKLDLMRNEITDSLQRDRDNSSSFNKKSETLTKSVMTSSSLSKNKNQEKVRTQLLQKQQIKGLNDTSNIN